ncbi:YchJ family protein [Mycobacterium sp. IDR2000157661]|uniref:YchJ family protein n=1 Tax=Mycobacterium sp. IDR2000157661 TaxID=2867005 RepID=UPI00351CD311|nr:hypothetical protein K3G64_16810 [Mycobacterium sp. IDR2000157661]
MDLAAPSNRECPGGNVLPYAACCEPLNDGVRGAATAEALMRSRYSAYAKGLADYLFRTWHPRTRPQHVTVDADVVWSGLEVEEVIDGG